MYRNMVRTIFVAIGVVISGFSWNADIVRAQALEVPVLPMNVEFRYRTPAVSD